MADGLWSRIVEVSFSEVEAAIIWLHGKSMEIQEYKDVIYTNKAKSWNKSIMKNLWRVTC